MNAVSSIGFGHYIAQADLISKFLLGVLILMSLVSWILIGAKGTTRFLGNRRSAAFLDFFWNARSLEAVEQEILAKGAREPFSHLSAYALHAQDHHARHGVSCLDEAGSSGEFITRTIKKVLDEQATRLDAGLTTLATIGATAPFVGLFGTVWGVYHALIAIGLSGAGTLDKVAGPVGEALIMTGIGLAVAIPAVIAYNAFVRNNRVLAARLDAFAYELHSFLTLGESPGAALRAEGSSNVRALPRPVSAEAPPAQSVRA